MNGRNGLLMRIIRSDGKVASNWGYIFEKKAHKPWEEKFCVRVPSWDESKSVRWREHAHRKPPNYIRILYLVVVCCAYWKKYIEQRHSFRMFSKVNVFICSRLRHFAFFFASACLFFFVCSNWNILLESSTVSVCVCAWFNDICECICLER